MYRSVGGRLFAVVFRGDIDVPVRLADLDIVAKDVVEPDFEVLDASALALRFFDLGDVRFAARPKVAQAVEVRVEAALDETTIAQEDRGIVGNGALQQLGERGWKSGDSHPVRSDGSVG